MMKIPSQRILQKHPPWMIFPNYMTKNVDEGPRIEILYHVSVTLGFAR